MGVLIGLVAATLAAPPIAEPFPENGDAIAAAPTPVRYVIPDLDPGLRPSLGIADDLFTINAGIRIVADATDFDQDSASVGQVGSQNDVVELRSLRARAFGTIGRSYEVRYRIAAEYKGFASDFSLAFPVEGTCNTLGIGKIKQPFSYEMENSVPNLRQN